MSYQPKEWSSTTPITVSSLNHIESGISEAHEAISEVNEAITETNSKVEQIAGGQIPEEYVQEAVEEYVNNNSGGFATKTELNTLDSKLSSEIVEVESNLSDDIIAIDNKETHNIYTSIFEQGGYYANPITGQFDSETQIRTVKPINKSNNLSAFYKVYCNSGYSFTLRASNKKNRDDYGFIRRSNESTNYRDFVVAKDTGEVFTNPIYFAELKQGITNIEDYDIYVCLRKADNSNITISESDNFIIERFDLEPNITRYFPRFTNATLNSDNSIKTLTDKKSYAMKQPISCKAGDRFRVSTGDIYHNNNIVIGFNLNGEKRSVNLPILEIVADTDSFNFEISNINGDSISDLINKDLLITVEKINYKKSTEYDCVVASFDSTESDKAKADIICGEKHAQEQLNCAINCNITSGNHARVLLLGGTYNINKFYNFNNYRYGMCLQHSLVGSKRYSVSISGKYMEHNGKDTGNTVIQLSEGANNEINTHQEFAILGAIRGGSRKMGNYFNEFALYVDKIMFKVFSLQKPCVCVDGAGLFQLGCENVKCGRILKEGEAETDVFFDKLTPVKGLIGFRGVCGSNAGKGNYLKHCMVTGYYEGIALTGEHFVVEDCLQHHCYYGWTIGNYDVEPKMEHPNVFIGNSVEQCYRIALLNRYGATEETEVSESKQTLIYIGGSIEPLWTNSNGEKVSMLPIKEVVKGVYRGRIELDWWNSPFEDDGSGKRMNYVSYDSNYSKYKEQTT